MLFSPEKYSIQDKENVPFIDSDEIWRFLNDAEPSFEKVSQIISKSLNLQRLSLEEVAILIRSEDQDSVQAIKNGARILKQKIYGNRIVVFAPLYIGNKCENDCHYCGFRASNTFAQRKTLNSDEIVENVKVLEENGHKRLILVFGEHHDYSADFIKECVEKVYSIKCKNGEIRRVNLNAPPFSVEEFRAIKKSGIGTYQIFQETYHRETYAEFHQKGNKSNYENRLTSLDRAQLAGIDDVGIGVLFGLYDWRFEVLALVRHSNHLEACYNVGPHTISFPRIQKASGINIHDKYFVSDDNFIKLVAILRLSVPYAGLILTARESEKIRDEVLQFGCSQIDAGTNIKLGAYATKANTSLKTGAEQFIINDTRSLEIMISQMVDSEIIPSFCTACYRSGRTGEHFMELCVPGFIHEFCTPNSFFTFAEYLEDYGNEDLKFRGYKLIEKTMTEMEKKNISLSDTRKKIDLIKKGKRDIYF